MLLIHVPRLTNRLGYTINVLFRYILRTEFKITSDIGLYESAEGPKLCYGQHKVGDGIFLRSADLLFQTTIEEQSTSCFRFEGVPVLFPVYNAQSDLPFDPFAASFYCLSRYEEYLPHITDAHGRFPASESLAFKEGFLMTAVVDRWIQMLAGRITERYPSWHYTPRNFDLEDTVDIDAAYCYRHKGVLRSIAGACRDLFSHKGKDELHRRARVLMRKDTDPYDCFDYVIDVHSRYQGMRLKFFALISDYNVYDKPISYLNPDFRELLQHLGDYAKMGMHGSYMSGYDPKIMAQERERLSSLLHRRTVRNRFHFLRLTLPKSYNTLIDCGVLHDYSMGFSEELGFRSGTGNSYPFFDLESDCETRLLIHPLAAVDSTFYHYKKCTLQKAEEAYFQLIDEVRAVGGTLSVVWHNQCLSDSFEWTGWRTLYERVLAYADAARTPIKLSTA